MKENEVNKIIENCIDISMNFVMKETNNRNVEFVDGVRAGADKGVRTALAYLMKYGYLTVEEEQ